MLRSFCVKILLFLCVLNGSAWAGTIEPKGDGSYGVILNVGFLYDEDDVSEWRAVFNLGSNMLWKASGNRVYLQKVNFYNNCPEIKADSDDEFKKKLKSKSSDFDILIYRSGTTAVQDERSFTIGRGINAGPIVLFERHALAEGQRETLGHELAHLIFGIADEYGEQGGGGVVTFYNAKERPPSEIFASIENIRESLLLLNDIEEVKLSLDTSNDDFQPTNSKEVVTFNIFAESSPKSGLVEGVKSLVIANTKADLLPGNIKVVISNI